jgi:penicillin-binding protein 1C
VAARLLGHQKKQVVSTLDGNLQRFVTDVLRHHLAGLRERHVLDGAALVTENETGHVLAYVGNIGEGSSARHVDGIRARRQAGSTLKPFLYGLAFEKRILTPASLLDDSPLDVPTPRGIYSPGNYDNLYRGLIPARVALASSLNIPAVRTLALIGEDPFVQQMERLGITGLRDGDHYGLSLALGTADICLWELVNAYRALANRGLWSPLTLEPEKKSRIRRPVFSKAIAFIISDILSDREARTVTFGLESPLSTRFWSAVKTGTSMDMRDNWCVGYSTRYTVGVWVGNFSGEPMWNVSGMTGAAPLWFEIMNYLHQGVGSRQPLLPENVIEKEIRFHDSGAKIKERFLKGTETDIIRHHSLERFPKIIYPPHGAIIALDPDIPPSRQKILFESAPGNREWKWVLNGKTCGKGDTFGWAPARGAYKLALVGENGSVKDRVSFKVR